MAFDAGEIVATLRLDKAGWTESLEEARAEADAIFKEPIDTEVKPELDQEAVDQVQAEKEELATPVEFPVSPVFIDTGEAELIGQTIAADILDAASLGGGGLGAWNVIENLLGQGITQAELGGVLSQLGFSGAEIQQALANMLTAELSTGLPAIGAGGTTFAEEILGSIMAPEGMQAAWDKVLGDVWVPTAATIEANLQRALGARGFGPGGDALGQSVIDSLIEGMGGASAGRAALTTGLTDAGFTAEAVALSIDNVLNQAAADAEKNAPNLLERFVRSVGSFNPASLFDSLTLGNGGMISAIFNPIGVAAGTAFLAGFGAIIGGVAAGAQIGLAGTLFAVIPGLLDLLKGYEAHVAQSTKGASLAGFTPAQLALGTALGGLIGPASKGIGAAETEIMPQITKFIDALTKAIPLLDKFAQPAIRAMTGFFDAIDKGMGSGNFKRFIDAMSRDVGPIMDEFGTFILNMGGAWGGFLELFGGTDASSVGHWFDDASKRLDNFLNHVKLGKGFIDDMKKTFKDLGDILGAAWAILGKLGGALLPVGVAILGIVGPFATWVADIVKLVPSGILGGLVAGVIALAGGLKLVAVAQGLLDAATSWNIYLIALAAAVAIVIVLVKYWRDLYQWGVDTHVAIVNAWKGFASWFGSDVAAPVVRFFKSMWTDIRNDAQAAWNFLDHDIFQPIADFFVRTFQNTLNNFKNLWSAVWTGIKDTVLVIWAILKPIFETITTAIKVITGGLKDIVGLFSGPGGNLSTYKGGGGGIPGITSSANFTKQSMGGLVVYVDARGSSTDSTSVAKTWNRTIAATLPALHAALARGAA